MKSILIGIVLTILSISVFAQERFDNLFTKKNNSSVSGIATQNQLNGILSAQVLEINSGNLKSIYLNPKVALIVLPTQNGDLILEIEPTKVFSADFKINTPQGEHKMKLPVFYRGKIKGESNSTVVLTVTNNTVEGMIWSKKVNLTIGKIKNDSKNLHVVYNTEEIKNDTPICAGEIEKKIEGLNLDNSPRSTNVSNCRVVEIMLEADFYTFTEWGGTTNVVNTLSSIFNNVVQLYKNDEINIQLSEIFVWTTVDPYNPASNTGAMLDSLTNYWDNQGNNFNGDIVHLVSAKSYGGGVAYYLIGSPVYNGMQARAVFGNCSKNYAKGLSTSLSSTVNNIPTFSWNVEVMTHEIGHNFGLPHTHNCSWSDGVNPPNAIDNCGPTAGYTEDGCTSGPTPAPGGGTIMSYCHLTSTGIVFSNGFGPLVKQKMAAEVNAASCLGGVLTPKPTVGTTFVCNNSSASITASGCTGGVYKWYTSLNSTPEIFTGNPYNSGILNSNTVYYVTCTQNSCESFRTAAVVELYSGTAPVTSDISICGSTSVANLSANGCSGFTLNWYGSPAGGTVLYTGNNVIANGIVSDTTFYAECQSTSCGVSPRSALHITIGGPCPYCEPTGLKCSDNDLLTQLQITFGAISLYDENFTCNPSGFSLVTPSPQVNFTKGASYNFNVFNPGNWEDGIAVWMDLNNDGTFSNSELIYSFYNGGLWTNKTFAFQIPNTATAGLTRMRIKTTYLQAPVDPCSALEGFDTVTGLYFGDIKDFIVNISGCNPSEIYGAIAQPSGTYKASETIESQANVANNTTYQAGKSILLKPGFQAGTAEVFRAQIAGCN
ncbi:MAG: hypothetical protein IPH28_05130 [Cytophagaceae bacterium]|nr:hypothetical protein [Cytophagaceae bacterium]